jgi:DNA polymerase III delta subunit
MSLPPVSVASGDDRYLRERFARWLKTKMSCSGHTVVEMTKGQDEDLSMIIASTGFLFVEPTFVELRKPDKKMLQTCLRQLKNPNDNVRILIVFEGSVPSSLSTLTGQIPKRYHKTFKAGSRWKAEEVAVAFVGKEVRTRGRYLPADLAKELVRRAGTDRGLLSFEVRKIVALAGDAPVIESSHLGAVHRMVELPMFAVVDSLALRSRSQLIESCQVIRETHSGDSTMRLCKTLISSVLKWLKARYYKELGFDTKAASSRLKVNQYVYDKMYRTPVSRWTVKGLLRLLDDLSKVERSVLRGSPNPWAGLVVRLTRACSMP